MEVVIALTIVRFKRLHPDAVIPKYANCGDAGMDLFSIESLVLHPHERQLVHTGIALELPTNTEAQVRPRSGLALKYGITVLNSPGTIDEGFRGEIGIILINHGDEDFCVEKYMRIAQLVISPVIYAKTEETNVLTESTRGEKGFGSSGARME